MQQRTDREAIGAEVRAGLARKGLTQKDLAAALGMTGTTLSGRIRGRSAFDTDELATIARVLDLSIADLFPAAEPADNSAA